MSRGTSAGGDRPGPTPREAEVRALLAAAKRSGLSRAEFCRRRGLSPGTVSWWQFEVRRRDRAARAARGRIAAAPTRRAAPVEHRALVPFVEVRLAAAAPSAPPAPLVPPSAPLEIVVASGHIVRVPPGFDADTLRRLLGVMAVTPAC